MLFAYPDFSTSGLYSPTQQTKQYDLFRLLDIFHCLNNMYTYMKRMLKRSFLLLVYVWIMAFCRDVCLKSGTVVPTNSGPSHTGEEEQYKSSHKQLWSKNCVKILKSFIDEIAASAASLRSWKKKCGNLISFYGGLD